MKCYVINPATGQPCGSEEHLARDCPYNTGNGAAGAATSTNLATDMRTPTHSTSYWGPEYVTSLHEPLRMIVADESSGDSHDNHEHVRGVLESMGLDPDADGYEADFDISKS